MRQNYITGPCLRQQHMPYSGVTFVTTQRKVVVSVTNNDNLGTGSVVSVTSKKGAVSEVSPIVSYNSEELGAVAVSS